MEPKKKTKVCSRCGQRKPVSEFCRQTAAKDGLAYWCKACIKAYNKAHRTEITAQKKAYYRTPIGRAVNKRAGKKYRKSKRGHLKGVLRDAKNRCYNPNDSGYPQYGERGIKICKRWLNKKAGFDNFFSDMSSSYTKGLWIDRINVNGNYKPSNCRWVTREISDNNTQKTIERVKLAKQGLKRCSRCKKILPVAGFNKCKTTKSKLASSCKTCMRKYQQQRKTKKKKNKKK